MKVLHLISSGGMYGAEVMLVNLASAQKRLGCEPVIGVFRNKHLPHIEVAVEARSRGLQVEILDCSGRFDHKPLGTIRKVLQKENISLVHGHGYKSNFYGYFAAKALGLPFVATCHLWTGASPTIRFYEFLDSLILRRAHKVVGVSGAISDSLRKSGLSPEKVLTIFNGTDFSQHGDSSPTLRRELGIGERILVGSVGRLEDQKGFEYFLRAARQVLSEFPETLFVVVGTGSLRSRLEGLIQELGLGSNVLLVGQRNDMPGVYESLDLFVLASIDEGMPMTILEALALARPVVATQVGAVDKLVIEERTGLLVEPRDVPALSNAILRCLKNPSFARELGRTGEAHIRKSFSAEAMAENYLETYRQVLSGQETDTATLLNEA